MTGSKNSAAVAMATSCKVLTLSLAKHLANGRIVYCFSRATVPVHDSTNCISIVGGRNQGNEVTHTGSLGARWECPQWVDSVEKLPLALALTL